MKIKKFILFCFLQSFNFHLSFSQGGTWTWISGSNIPNDTGVYGIQGVPSVNNHPPALYAMGQWKDKEGNFWIYGGGDFLFYSDLWKYNPLTNEWTWVKGDGKIDDLPVFGTKGVSNSSNFPGYRGNTMPTWVDTAGSLWLFSGYNWGNDLWKYDININAWTWIAGDTVPYFHGIYGTQGVPSPLNTPGSLFRTGSAWTDSLNNLWLFGGWGYDSISSMPGYLNDLWKYGIGTNEWTWMKGSDSIDISANYGIKGIPLASNDPGGRWTYTRWKDIQGNFWLMGGGAGGNGESFNDVWKYDLIANEWIWMDGPDTPNDLGNYLTNCIFDTINMPQNRVYQNSAVTDNCDRFWLFGGANNSYGGNNTFNDLWVFDPQQLKWNWISGTALPDQPGNYGTLGFHSPANIPSSRGEAAAWWGNDNKFYLFGGRQINTNNEYADLWVFTPDTNCVPICDIAEGISEVKEDNTFLIYPNPTAGMVTVIYHLNSNKGILQLYDLIGKLVGSFQLDENTNAFEFDASYLCCGVFQYRIIDYETLKGQGKLVIIK